MKTIAVGYDGSEAAERALERAAELAEALAASLVVVSVAKSGPAAVPEPMLAPAAPAVVPAGPIGPVPLVVPEPERQPPDPGALVHRDLEHARMRLAGRRVEAEYVAEVGDAAERLLAVAEERDADLLVVGAPDHSLVERLFGRAVDESVARGARRDVLLVR